MKNQYNHICFVLDIESFGPNEPQLCGIAREIGWIVYGVWNTSQRGWRQETLEKCVYNVKGVEMFVPETKYNEKNPLETFKFIMNNFVSSIKKYTELSKSPIRIIGHSIDRDMKFLRNTNEYFTLIRVIHEVSTGHSIRESGGETDRIPLTQAGIDL